MTKDEELYMAAKAADEAWSAELVRVYGQDAGDVRYTARGYATPELKRLHDARMDACEAWWNC